MATGDIQNSSLYFKPRIEEVGKIYTQKPTDGTGDFDFSRASNATIINKDGLIETVGSNIPRLNYPMIDGVVSGCPSLLLEPSRTNSLLQSNQFDTTWILSASIDLTSGQNGVFGSNDAWLLKRNSTGSRYVQQSLSLSSAKYSYSVYLKAESTNWAYLWSYDDSASVNAYFDLENGVVGNTSGSNLDNATIESVGNGWYRCILTYTRPTTIVRIYPAYSNGNISTGTDNGIYIQNAQLEQGSYATSYIPTNGAIATILQDDCSIADLLTNGILTSNNFSFIFDFTLDYQNAKDNGGGFVQLRDSSNNRLFRIYINTLITGRIDFRNESPIDEAYMIVASNQKKIGISVTNGIVSYFVNGIKGGTMTSTLSDVEKLYLNTPAMVDGGSIFAAQILAFNRGLTDAEMITKTTL